jgi:hypothetical protein
VNFSDEDREALLSKPIVSKDLSSWKDNDWKIVPYNGDLKELFDKWAKDTYKEPNKMSPSK